jgi:hypothetical protein
MIKYVNRTVRIHANEKLGISIDEALDKELQYIYTENKKINLKEIVNDKLNQLKKELNETNNLINNHVKYFFIFNY